MDRLIFTHKDMTCPEGYEVVDNRGRALDDRLWSEWAGIDYAVSRYAEKEKEKAEEKDGTKAAGFPPDFVQVNHYRRRIDPDCTGRNYIAQPIVLSCTVAQQYAACHFAEDLQACGKAVKEINPQLATPFENAMNSRILVPYNIVCCRYAQFMDWAKFVLDILKKTYENMGSPSYDDMLELMKSRKQPEDVQGRNYSPEYQARVLGFLSERVSSLYWMNIAAQVPVFPAAVIKDKDTF